MERWSRRILLDLLLSMILLIMSLPLIIVLAVGSAISLRAWPIFTQERVGRDGKPFRFAKIRSLPVNAPKYATKYELESVTKTRFGSFLRATHLDELPQLALVVTGKMSLVGPRPDMKSVLATFDPAFVEHRLAIRPGCTGLWQISRDADKMIGECPEYDLYYVANCSVRLDVWVMWRTAVQLLPRERGVKLADVPRWTRPWFKRASEQDPLISSVQDGRRPTRRTIPEISKASNV